MLLRSYAIVFLLLNAVNALAAPYWKIPERREDPYPTQEGHLFVPLPYSMPGIGEGYFLMGYLANQLDTTLDAAVVWTQGDAPGLITQLDEIPLIEDRLHLQLFDMNIDKVTVNDYESRGTDALSHYNLVELSDVRQQSAELTLSLWQRRFALSARYNDQSEEASALRDSDGTLLARYDPPVHTERINRGIGTMLDLTDDYQDPRQGIRLRLDASDHPPIKSTDPDYFVMDYSLLYYQPVNNGDTLVFNLFRSDVHMRSTGATDPAVVLADLGGTVCAPSDFVCLIAENQRVNNIITTNRYGTATSLGGTDRMRSYPDGRLTGAHAEFVGIELRSNFVQDAVPFNYFIWKDVRTSIQLAFFVEAGTVAETRDELWKETHTSYGIGARMVTASGSVYRADWAAGDEEAALSLFFYYPWK
jgi:hypothetical protein